MREHMRNGEWVLSVWLHVSQDKVSWTVNQALCVALSPCLAPSSLLANTAGVPSPSYWWGSLFPVHNLLPIQSLKPGQKGHLSRALHKRESLTNYRKIQNFKKNNNKMTLLPVSFKHSAWPILLTTYSLTVTVQAQGKFSSISLAPYSNTRWLWRNSWRFIGCDVAGVTESILVYRKDFDRGA